MQWLPENPTFVKLFAITIFVKGTTPKNKIEVLEEDAKTILYNYITPNVIFEAFCVILMLPSLPHPDPSWFWITT